MGGSQGKARSEVFDESLHKFRGKELKDLKKSFKKLCTLSGSKKSVDKDTFMAHFAEGKKEDFHLPPNLAEHLFHAFDDKNENKIDYEQFIVGIAMCCKGSSDEKMEFIFHVLANNEGFVMEDELLPMMRSSVEAVYNMLHLEIDKEESEALLNNLIEDAKTHFQGGKLNYEEFKKWAEENAQVMDFFEVLLHKGYQANYVPATKPSLPEAPAAPPSMLSENGSAITSDLLDGETLVRLRAALPSQHWNSDLELIYKPSLHGYSLKTLYNRVGKGATLIVIKDKQGHRFGAFCPVAPTDHGTQPYGDADVFLFKLSPEFHIYIPTGNNNTFITSSNQYISFGGPAPTYALWLDSDIDKGVSKESPTFANQCLASSEEFSCVSLECWSFRPKRSITPDSHATIASQTTPSLTRSSTPGINLRASTTKETNQAPPINKEQLAVKGAQVKLVELEHNNQTLQAELERIKKELEREKQEKSKLEKQISSPTKSSSPKEKRKEKKSKKEKAHE
eukprot:TRINITY_DN3372_c0_g1_i2.p1 TRINITY_DN3372_c0_g1~~TRINITY_DN3372_c0_g1_i2.p1  ORF type:complete len:508 (+),score=164.23 TRINITY_DN3372_c0_g1_i2:193-1716(+)